MSKVMSWSTNWPTKVKPDVRSGLGFSLRASLWSLVTTTGLPLLQNRLASLRVGEVGADDRLFLHGLTQRGEQVLRGPVRRLVLEHVPEATLGRGALEHQIKATKLGAVRFDRHLEQWVGGRGSDPGSSGRCS